jgi:hypothetical protein
MQCPKEDGLYKELAHYIDKIKRKKGSYTYWKNSTRMILLLLGACITLIAGWNITMNDKISLMVSTWDISEGHMTLILSTIITLITAIEALFKFSEKATTYGVMLFELRNLRRKICYDFEKDPALYLANKDAHFNDYQEILKSQKELIEESQA